MDDKEWRKLIIDELRLLRGDVSDMKSEVATLKVRSTLWGGASGGFMGVFSTLIGHVIGK